MYTSTQYSFWHTQEPQNIALKFAWRHKLRWNKRSVAVHCVRIHVCLTHSKIEKPMCTVFTRQKSALRHTSMDLHSIHNTEVCFGTHLRAICTVFTNAFERWACALIYFGGALCDTPPRDLHSFYQCLWALDMGSFYFGGALFAHLRAICTVFTTTYALRRCARLGTL